MLYCARVRTVYMSSRARVCVCVCMCVCVSKSVAANVCNKMMCNCLMMLSGVSSSRTCESPTPVPVALSVLVAFVGLIWSCARRRNRQDSKCVSATEILRSMTTLELVLCRMPPCPSDVYEIVMPNLSRTPCSTTTSLPPCALPPYYMTCNSLHVGKLTPSTSPSRVPLAFTRRCRSPSVSNCCEHTMPRAALAS